MRPAWPAALAALVLSACNLAGDVTPPPGLATAQALRPDPLPTSQPVAFEVPPTAPDPRAGAVLYRERCEACHGETGLGDGAQAQNLPNPPAPLGDPALARAAEPAAWYAMVTQGDMDRFMPPFASLSDQERWDVVAYALSLSYDQSEIERAESLYQAECAACHGTAGQGTSEGPDLTDPADLAARSRADVFSILTTGAPPGMPDFESSLKESDRWALAAYVQNLAFVPSTDQAVETGRPPEVDRALDSRGQGSLVVTLINGTAGAAPPEDMEIVLHAFEGQTEVWAEAALPDASGQVAFAGLELASDRLHIASAEYRGVTYASEPILLEAGQEPAQLSLVVYETAAENSALHVDRLHLLADYNAEGNLEIIELWVLSNLGDRTIAPAAGDPGVEISLPEGARNLAFEGGVLGGRFLTTERGFADQAPLRPGRGNAQLVFSFEWPYSRNQTFLQPFDYPVSAVTILVPEGGPRVTGEGVVDRGVEQVGGARLRHYTVPSLAAGEILSLSFSPPPGALAAGLGRLPWEWGLGVGALALAGAAAARWFWPSRARWRRGPRAGELPAEVGRQALLRAMAALDDSFESGEVGEEEYRLRRDELKRRVIALVRAEGEEREQSR